MFNGWFNSKTVVEVGNALGDHILAARARAAPKGRKEQSSAQDAVVQSFLKKVDSDARPLRLGMFRRAKLANTFKWRLLEKGVDPAVADQLTKLLLIQLSR
jgi:hypothetical protein